MVPVTQIYLEGVRQMKEGAHRIFNLRLHFPDKANFVATKHGVLIPFHVLMLNVDADNHEHIKLYLLDMMLKGFAHAIATHNKELLVSYDVSVHIDDTSSEDYDSVKKLCMVLCVKKRLLAVEAALQH